MLALLKPLALSAAAATFALQSLSACLPANAGYRPPSRSVPTRTDGTGTRAGANLGCTQDFAVPLTALAPADYVGQTISGRPSFFWYQAESKAAVLTLYELPAPAPTSSKSESKAPDKTSEKKSDKASDKAPDKAPDKAAEKAPDKAKGSEKAPALGKGGSSPIAIPGMGPVGSSTSPMTPSSQAPSPKLPSPRLPAPNLPVPPPPTEKVIWVKNIPAQKSRILQLPFALDQPELSTDKIYRWEIEVVCDPSQPANKSGLATGFIQRVAPTATLTQALAKAKTAQAKADVYANAGLWYDTLNETTRAIVANPQNTSLDQDFYKLLEQAGYKKIADRERTAQ